MPGTGQLLLVTLYSLGTEWAERNGWQAERGSRASAVIHRALRIQNCTCRVRFQHVFSQFRLGCCSPSLLPAPIPVLAPAPVPVCSQLPLPGALAAAPGAAQPARQPEQFREGFHRCCYRCPGRGRGTKRRGTGFAGVNWLWDSTSHLALRPTGVGYTPVVSFICSDWQKLIYRFVLLKVQR